MFHISMIRLLLRGLVIASLFYLGFPSIYAQSDNFKVVIDPGHGGKDPGNVHNGYYEKTITLAISKKVAALLNKEPDVDVSLTRDRDVAVDLYARGPIANKRGADVFVSIHCDAHDSNAHGAGTFVLGLHRADKNIEVAKRENAVIYREEGYTENYAKFNSDAIGVSVIQEENLNQSIQLAYKVQNGLVKRAGRRDRQVKQAGFVVLYGTVMPSILIEVGFLSNSNEGSFLNSNTGQQKVAEAIAAALIDYKNEFFMNSIAFDQPIADSTTYYRIQLAASDRRLSENDPFFKGLKPIYLDEVSAVMRYFYGRTSSFQTAQELLKQAHNKGFKDAFIAEMN